MPLPNYTRPNFDLETAKALQKPMRGTGVLEREKERATAKQREIEIKREVKRRDVVCQWPEAHKCRGGLECAHLVDASLGGAMEPENLILLCAWIHRRGPESIHGKQLKIDGESTLGAKGILAFWRKGADGAYYLVARKFTDGTTEKD